jgi:uncharacterized protein (UPF0276 family)
MVFSPALRPFLQRQEEPLDLLEIEPQTLWLADDALEGPFFEFTPGIDFFDSLPGHKLVHSVGVPLGGTRTPNPAQTELLRLTAERLNSPWVSEHLSVGGTPHQAAGFLLPPLQTDEGVEIAVRNIRSFAKAIGRPIAIETGVAYTRRKPFEMPDGEFVAQIVQETGCGLLLDLHNIYCNEKNGRITMENFLADIPLERVWEVHLAGGVEMEGFWLDSHSGAMPEDLAVRSRKIVKALSNLGAINFEIYDTFLERLDEQTYNKITDEVRLLWSESGQSTVDAIPVTKLPRPLALSANLPTPQDWEVKLTQAVWQAAPDIHPWAEDQQPLKLYSFLARSFRGSMITRTLPRTMRYLILREEDMTESLLQRYYSDTESKLYAPLEAQAFADWILTYDKKDPLLEALINYDIAFFQIIREGKPQIVNFPGNPTPVFEALAAGHLPDCPEPPSWELEILPDSYSIADFAASHTNI